MKLSTKKLRGFLGTGLALIGVVAVYLLSVLHVGRITLTSGDAPLTEETVIRIAHHLNDRRVQVAFSRLAEEYQRLHPGVRIEIQSIPQRAYDQWATTQLMGGTPPDLVQMLGRAGIWEILGQQYLVPLTAHIGRENPYNRDTELEGRPWRDTYIDRMEGGYFFHVMDFFSIPMTIDNSRVFYNKDLYRLITGSDEPPADFRSWMAVCRKIREYSAHREEELYPIAVSQEDYLFSRYFPTLTAGIMDPYSIWQGGNPEYISIFYGLASNSFDLKQERIRMGFLLLRELYAQCQPSFLSDLAEQKRFLFLQGRSVMAIGTTRDIGIFKELADFSVGVFDFPQVDPDDPVYGRFYEGRSRENPLTTFAFGLSQASRNPSRALDFMMFCTSQKQNEQFCAELSWYPAILGSEVCEADLRLFQPVTEGVSRYPALDPGHGPINLFFEQNFPLYLDGQLTFEGFMDKLATVFLRQSEENFQFKLDMSLGNRHQTEYNVAKERAKMLFEEAGPVQAGSVMGSRTSYQLGLEIGEMHDNFINVNQYTFHAIPEGRYRYPLFQEEDE